MEPGETTELRPLGSSPQGDSEEEQRVSWFQKTRDKLANVNWKTVLLVAIICTGNFVVFCSISLIGAFFPTEALDKGSSLFATGFIIAMAPLSATIFAPIFGYFLPKMTVKYAMSGALIIVGVAYITLGVTIYLPSGMIFIVVCCVLRFIEGFGTSLYNTTIIALLAHLYPNSLGTVFGIKQTTTGLGYATGPAIGGILYLAGGYMTPFFVVGVVCLIFVIPLFLLTSKVPSTEISRRVLSIKSLFRIMTNVIAAMLVMARVILHAGLGYLVATYAVYVRQQFGLTPSQTGPLFLTISVPYIIFASVGGQIADKINTRLNNIIGLTLCGIGFQIVGPSTLIPVQPALWVTIIGLLMIGIGLGTGVVSYPGVYAVLSRDMGHSDALKGIVGGLAASAVAVGELIGPIIGGGLTTLVGFQAGTSVYGEVEIFWMILLLCVSIIDYLIRKRTVNKCKSHCNNHCTSSTHKERSEK